MIRIELDEGYTVELDDNGICRALRDGEPWRDLSGDQLVIALIREVEDLAGHVMVIGSERAELEIRVKELESKATSAAERKTDIDLRTSAGGCEMTIDTNALRIMAERGEITVCKKNEAIPQVIDFETFAAMRGASRLGYCEDGVVSPAGHMPRANWRRVMRMVAEYNAELAQRRTELRKEYQRLVAEGKVRPPSHIERLLEAANGHEDRAQTHAARRVLAKRGIDWRAEK